MTGRLWIVGIGSTCFFLIFFASIGVGALDNSSGIVATGNTTIASNANATTTTRKPKESAPAHRPAIAIQMADFGRLSGRFHQTKSLKELDVKIQTSGQFQINKSDSEATVVHWNLERPKKSQICIDKDGLVIEDSRSGGASKKRLSFSEVGKEAGGQVVSLTKLMTMDFRAAEENFIIEKKGKAFVLKPRDEKGSFFESVDLELSSEGFLKNIEIKEKSGDEIAIQFSDFSVGKAVKGEKCGF